jgi:hypothetical protein
MATRRPPDRTTVIEALVELGLSPLNDEGQVVRERLSAQLTNLQQTWGIEVTGELDAATGILVVEVLAAFRVAQRTKLPWPCRAVHGRVASPEGEAAPDLDIELIAAGFRSDRIIGRGRTNRTGQYEIAYPHKAIDGQTSLVVRVLDDGALAAESAPQFQAPPIIEVDLSVGATHLHGPTELEQIIAEVQHRIGEVAIADLNITDVTFLATATGRPAELLTDLVVAARLATKRSLPESFSYALFRENALAGATPGRFEPRFTIDLSADLDVLYYEIVLLPRASLEQAVTTAVAARLVPATLSGALSGILATLAKSVGDAQRYFQTQQPVQIFNAVATDLNAGKAAQVRAVLQADARGDISKVATDLSAIGFSDGKQGGPGPSIGSLLAANPALAELLRQAFGGAAGAGATGDPVSSGVGSSGTGPSGDTARPAPRSRSREATAKFIADLDREGPDPGLPHGRALSDLLKRDPDFDLATGSAKKLLRTHAATQPEVHEPLRAVQRVFKLAPTYPQTKALLGVGIRSAADVVGMGRDRFVRRLSRTGTFTDTEARHVFHKAADIHTAAGLLAAELRSLSAPAAQALSSPATTEFLSAVSRDNPNLKSLFHLVDLCECQDCKSVTSASAYVVDVVQFLKNRLVVDTTAGPPVATKTAKDVLFARRPDLGDLDLSCDNTNIELPQIDVANELLEDIVAPDPGFAWTGALAAGAAPAGLVTALVGQGFPFTSAAFVQGPDLAGAFAVRDAKLVGKLTPTGVNTWNVRLLRQTTQSAAALAAAPQYQNDAAYTTLVGSQIAFHLPFDLYHQESRGYFDQFGLARSDLMRALATAAGPADRDIAADALGIADQERALIVTPNAAQQNLFWNTPGSPASNTMNVVDPFLTSSELQYSELTDLLARRFINPTANLFIHHNDSSCDTTQKVIQNLDDTALDRMHRFLRLQKRLGWSLGTVDRAVMAPRLGNGTIDDTLIVALADLASVGARFPSLPLESLIACFGTLSLEGDPSPYAAVFFNAANGTLDPMLSPAGVTANEAAPPATQKKLSQADGAALAVALNVTPDDLTSLIAAAGDPSETFASLSAVWARVTLARALGRSITDFLLWLTMTGIDPLAGPRQALALITSNDRLASAGLKPADLQFLLTFTATDLAARTLPEANVTATLAAIQKGLQAAYGAARSPFDGTRTPDENKAGARALLAQLPNVQPTDLTTFESVLDGTYTGVAATFLAALLADVAAIGPIQAAQVPLPTDAAAVNTALSALAAAQAQLEAAGNPGAVAAAQAAIAAAQSQLDGANTQLATDQLAFLHLVLAGVSDYLYAQAAEGGVVAAIASAFHLAAPMATVLVEGAHLAGRTLLAILSDQALIDTIQVPPQPPAITPAAFPDPYASVRLLRQMALLVAALGASSDRTAWLLANAAGLGWLQLELLPYQTGIAPVALSAWADLVDGLAFIVRYPPSANPADPNAPFTVEAVLEAALAPGPTLGALLDGLAAVTGWDRDVLTDLDARLGFSTPDLSAYRQIATFLALERAVVPLRLMGVTVGGATAFIQPQLDPAAARALRQALKARYDESTWLGVLQQVMDPLRQKKRDALVAYILANNPSLTSSDDLFDDLLIDIETCSCMPTSRIVAAHGTLQLFIQRCLLGVEPTAVADVAEDDGWSQWSWMSQFRVWQANRQIFLYPENWTDETLRDDKSELFTELESSLRQNPLTDDNITTAATDYLQALDDISFLEVVTTCYDERLYTMHVFARTKGGDPSVYYHRQFIEEKEWTPWEKVDLDISSDILMAFIRDDRLNLAWPVFSEQPNDDQSIAIPPATPGTPVEKTQKSYKIQLAISQQANGKWQPKRTSKDWLDWQHQGYYERLPTKELFRFIPLDLHGAGFAIMCTFVDDGVRSASVNGSNALVYLGAFTLTGCKGYPEPIVGNTVTFDIRPKIKHSELRNLRWIEDNDDVEDDLSIWTFLGGEWVALLNKTPGIFRVTYPQDFTLIDLVLFYLEIWRRSLGPKPVATTYASVERYLVLPLGTFLPYFYEDGARGYVAIPGYYSAPDLEKGGQRLTRWTFTDALKFLQALIALVRKYLLLYEQDPNHDLNALFAKLLVDTDFLKLRDEFRVWTTLTYAVDFQNFYHPLVCALRKALYDDGIPSLMKRATQLQETSFSFQNTFDPTPVILKSYPTGDLTKPYAVEDVDFSLQGAYSSYNWELFFHLPLEIAVRLSKDQQFEEAMTWFHYIFDPTDASNGTVPQKYWKTKPFFQRMDPEYVKERIDTILEDLAGDPTGATLTDLKFAVEQWRENPFEPFVVARSRTVAFQQTVLMKYLDNLIAWGDSLFTQFTRESVVQATQLYVLADKLLGPKPRIVPPIVTPPLESFNQLEAKIDLFGNALLDLENLVPDLGLLPHGGAELPPPPLSLHSLYFCVPPNPNLLNYWSVVDDRLFKIRNCQDITGTPRPLALFAPPIDPGALVAAAAAGLSPSQIVAGLNAPLPFYRFATMVQKATELTQQVVSLGSALQAALEKRDAEALALLKSNQELRVLNLVKAVKQDQIKESGIQIDAIQKSIDMTTFKSQYYHARPFLNDQESLAQDLTTAALISQAAALALDIVAGVGHLIPWLGIGAAGFGGSPQANANYGGSNIGNSSTSFADVARQTATILQTRSGLATQLGSFERRQDEWTFQAGLADKELIQLGRQLAAAQLRQGIATKDLAAHQQSIDNANETLGFLQTKFTNQDLYDYLIDQISGTYFQAYQLAFDCAQKAQHCFQYELGSDATFLTFGYWDSLRKGLFAGEALLADLKRMEKGYYDTNKREYELTKAVSLAQLDPRAILELKNTGACTFNLPETIFDLDHPGHYFRRLKTVALTIPAVAGPYTSVSATLSLVGSRYRKDTRLNPGTGQAAYAETAGGDGRFVYGVGAIQQIATSQGQNDSGLFELSFRDERYLPFEGQGAIGAWRLEMPRAFRQFDYNTITDVVLTLKYTARDGGSNFASTVESAIKDMTNAMIVDAHTTGLVQGFNLRLEFPDEWFRFQQTGSVPLTIAADSLPFFTEGHTPTIQGATWLARINGNPATLAMSVDGASFNLAQNATLNKLCVGSSATMTLDTPFTLAATTPASIQELSLVVHYTLGS